MPFESISGRLLKAGVARRHVSRYVGELEDHLEELKAQLARNGCSGEEAELLARARLGNEDELVLAMLEQPCFRALSARMPWLIFSVMPTLIALALFFIPLAVLKFLSHLGDHVAPLASVDSSSVTTFAHYLIDTSNLVLAPAISALFAILVARQRLHFRWALLAAMSIAVLDLRLAAQFPSGAPVGDLFLSAVLWIDQGPELARTWLLSATQAVLTLLPVVIPMRWERSLN